MFWNREELPIELRDKKPAEIIEALKKLEEFEQKSKDWETSKTDLETKLNTQSTEFEQTKQRLQELEAGIQQAQQQAQQQQQQQQQPPDIWQDPDRYIDGKMLGAMQGPALAALQSLRIATGMKFQQGLQGRERRIFDKYANEIEGVINAFHPAAQGVEQNWRNAFFYVKGAHEQEIAKAEQEGSPFFSEPAARGSHEEEAPNPNEKLTAEEEEACRRFHWDPKGYLERKKEMAVHQSERGSYARFPVPQKKAV